MLDLSQYDADQIDGGTHSRRVHSLHAQGKLDDYVTEVGGTSLKAKAEHDAGVLDAAAKFFRTYAKKANTPEKQAEALANAEAAEGRAQQIRAAVLS